MIWRKVRLMLWLPFMIALFGWITILLFNAGHKIVAVGIGIFIAFRSVQFIRHYLNMHELEVEADEKSFKEMSLTTLLAVGLAVFATLIMGYATEFDERFMGAVPFINLAILLPAVAIGLIRGLKRTRHARREAEEQRKKEARKIDGDK